MDAKQDDALATARKIASGMLTGEIDLEDGSEQLQSIYIELGFPEILKDWMYLPDGHSREYYDRTLIPGVTKYNHEKWVATVLEKARIFVEETVAE